MITIDTLKEVIKQSSSFNSKGKVIEREKKVILNGKSVIVVMGVRRCGKSTLLRQLLKDTKNLIFLNFEDTRLDGFELSDFQKVEQIALDQKSTCFLFDEIQNIPEWEKFVRSAHDKGLQIYITGSNASMLSRELGTKLTGRHLQIELFPFNYSEYLIFNNETSGSESFNNYILNGGFPEYLESNNTEYLRSLLRDIVIRDIAVRRHIKNDHIILRLAVNLMSNVSKEISYNNVSKIIGIKSVRTMIDYCDYLKESYLFDFVPRFSFSIKQQLMNPKKVYAIDTGMARANSLSFSEDNGRMLENSVYLYLRQNNTNILYFNDGTVECDFLVRKNEKIVEAIQVCWHVTEDNLKREITGLRKAMETTGAENGMIITFDQEDTFDEIKVMPAWKWMNPKQ